MNYFFILYFLEAGGWECETVYYSEFILAPVALL